MNLHPYVTHFQVKRNIHAIMKKKKDVISYTRNWLDREKHLRNIQRRTWIVENCWDATNTRLFDQDQGQRTGKLRLLVTNFNFSFIKHLQKQINACNGCQAAGKVVFLTPQHRLLNTNTISAAKSSNTFKMKHSLRKKTNKNVIKSSQNVLPFCFVSKMSL